MRILITLLALLAFGLHLLLGCCWHHAHGAGELPGRQHEATGHHVHLPFCCHHEHEHPHDPAQNSPDESAPHAPCSDPQCVYLSCDQLQVPHAQDGSWPLALIEAPPSCNRSVVAAYELAEHETISPHLRRHLALSRLLN